MVASPGLPSLLLRARALMGLHGGRGHGEVARDTKLLVQRGGRLQTVLFGRRYPELSCMDAGGSGPTEGFFSLITMEYLWVE